MQKLVEVRADGARRSKGIRSFEKFPVSRDALDKFEPGGEPSSLKFLFSGPGLTRRVKHGFSFERCCIETCASYFHPVIVFLFSLFLFPAFPHVSLPLFSGKQEFVRFRRVDVLEGQRWVSTRIPLSSDKFAGERAYVKSVAVGERK